jgi:hypothetical protein
MSNEDIVVGLVLLTASVAAVLFLIRAWFAEKEAHLKRVIKNMEEDSENGV